jgi:hypothetical protein
MKKLKSSLKSIIGAGLLALSTVSCTSPMFLEANVGQFERFKPRVDREKQAYHFDHDQVNVRVGATSKKSENLSYLTEISYSEITDGFGTYLFAVSPMIRYNPFSKKPISPYLQFGAGLVANDFHETETFLTTNEEFSTPEQTFKERYAQERITQPIEFYLQFGAGIKLDLPKDFSLIAEGKLEHISNAGLDGGKGNDGMDSSGFLFGLKKSF